MGMMDGWTEEMVKAHNERVKAKTPVKPQNGNPEAARKPQPSLQAIARKKVDNLVPYYAYGKIVLPIPPTANHCYITDFGKRKGKRIMTQEYRNYKEYASMLLSIQLKNNSIYHALNKVVLINYRFYFPDNRRRDVPDNYGKGLRDVLKGMLVVDDCWQIVGIETFGPHGIDAEAPRVEITWEI